MRVLADGRLKLTALTTKPVNPASPTVTELNAAGALDLSCKVLQEGFTFGAGDSDKVAEKALCDVGNANALGASNFVAGLTLWREFATAGGFDATGDAAFVALKNKGTTLWLYGRLSDKLATLPWLAADEIFLGAEVVTDTPQRSDGSGFIKYRIPLEVQRGYPFITVAAGV